MERSFSAIRQGGVNGTFLTAKSARIAKPQPKERGQSRRGGIREPVAGGAETRGLSGPRSGCFRAPRNFSGAQVSHPQHVVGAMAGELSMVSAVARLLCSLCALCVLCG
jgi:hypothetical protein